MGQQILNKFQAQLLGDDRVEKVGSQLLVESHKSLSDVCKPSTVMYKQQQCDMIRNYQVSHIFLSRKHFLFSKLIVNLLDF